MILLSDCFGILLTSMFLTSKQYLDLIYVMLGWAAQLVLRIWQWQSSRNSAFIGSSKLKFFCEYIFNAK